MGAQGDQLGIKSVPEALAAARALGLDLVEVAPQANPPVCRLMDFGKHLYEESQRTKESKRRQTQIVVKEMKFRPKIDKHDYETKKRHVARFLEDGARVKITIMFRGREMTHTELGARILHQLAQDLVEEATVEAPPKLDGRNMMMVLGPTRRDAAPRVRVEEERSLGRTRGKGKLRQAKLEELAPEAGVPEVSEPEVSEPDPGVEAGVEEVNDEGQEPETRLEAQG